MTEKTTKKIHNRLYIPHCILLVAAAPSVIFITVFNSMINSPPMEVNHFLDLEAQRSNVYDLIKYMTVVVIKIHNFPSA